MSSTFSGCTSLVNVPIIPDSVTNMSYTFENCTSLSSTIMTIPSLVTNMTGTFSGCTKLSGTIRINSTNVSYSNSSNYYPFYGTSKSIIVQVPSGSTTYTNMSKSSYKPRNVTISTFSS